MMPSANSWIATMNRTAPSSSDWMWPERSPLAIQSTRNGIQAATAATVSGRVRHGQAVNLDPAALVLDTVFKIQQTAAG